VKEDAKVKTSRCLAVIVVALAAVGLRAQTPVQTPVAQTPAQCSADVRTFIANRTAELRPLTSETSAKLTAERTAMIKECAAKFDVKTTADKDLPGLASLYADASRLDLATTAMSRALASTSWTPAERASLLSQSISLMLREPKGDERNARLEKVVDQLDAMPDALDQKIAAHLSMDGYYRGDDIDAGIIKHSTWLINTGKTLSPDMRRKYGPIMLSGYTDMAEAWAGQGRTPDALALLRRAAPEWPEVADAASRIQPLIDRYLLVGTKATAITAPRFLNAAAGTTRLEMTGGVTLLEFTAHWCGPCRESYPGINRLRARFGSRGFHVVMATQLYGYFQTERGLDAATELDRDRSYFAEHGLNVPVAVWDAISVSVKDGKVNYSPGPNQNEEAYKVGGIPQIHLIDRHGVIRLIMVGYDDANEPALAQFIDTLLKEK
jgi:thiol-disulfide isomerase/thioredoxin